MKSVKSTNKSKKSIKKNNVFKKYLSKKNKKNNKPSQTHKNKYTKMQKGGEFIGVGSFGCVVNPMIQCRKKIKDNNYVSKLSTYRSFDIDELESIYDEINIGKKILNIDKESKYLSPIINYCVFNLKKTKKRKDLKLNKLNDEDSLDEEIDLLLSTNTFNQKKCIINVNKNIIIINLILPNSGIDIDSFFKKKSQFKEQVKILKDNFKYSIYYLFEGLELLHKHEITHKDIKPHNMCISFRNNRPLIKYIDFGLSEHIKYLDNSYSNIFNSGTPCYMAPDFVLLVEMKRNSFDELLLDEKLNKYIIRKTYLSLKSNLFTFTNRGLNKLYLNGNYDSKLLSKNTYLSNNIVNKQYYFVSESDVKNMFSFLLKLYQENKLLEFYFMKYNGINPKLDIFSLGLSIFEMKNELNIKNILLTNLLKNMLELNSLNRYNIIECYDHIYFK